MAVSGKSPDNAPLNGRSSALGGLVFTPAMALLELRRLVRGWRWRALFLATFLGAYWFSRQTGFGDGSGLWFPAGVRGITGASLFIAWSAILFAVESISCWDRQRARTLLQSRLLYPGSFLLSRMLAVIVLCTVSAIIFSLWPAIGAWRADLSVVWSPNLAWVLFAALPLAFVGASVGLLARVMIASDAGAILLAMGLAAPACYWRLYLAPIDEVFLLASNSLGILVHPGTLIREALITATWGVLFLGIASLLLPWPRSMTPSARWPRPLTPLIGLINRFRIQTRLSSSIKLMLATLTIALGLVAPMYWMRLFSDSPQAMALTYRRTTIPGTVDGRIAPWRILHREIHFNAAGTGQLRITLLMEPMMEGNHQVIPISFGSSLAVAASSRDLLESEWIGPMGPVQLLKIPVLNEATQTATITLELEERPGARRLWERAWHPQFHRFSFLGSWWGESVWIDGTSNSQTVVRGNSPWSVTVPKREELSWLAGPATATAVANDQIRLEHPTPGVPSNLLAGPLVEIANRGTLQPDIRLQVMRQHAPMARQLFVIWAEQLERLQRLFGQPPQAIVLYEVPEAESVDPMAIPSQVLDGLRVALPNFESWEYSTRWQFLAAFTPIHLGLVNEMLTRRFTRIEMPLLLHEALVLYIHRQGLASGRAESLKRILRRDLILIPWDFAQRFDLPPIALGVIPAERDVWMQPIDGALRDGRLLPGMQQRLPAFHHMLRYVVGDDAYVRGIHSLCDGSGPNVLNLDSYRNAMEQASSQDLEWFFTQWLRVGVLPRYEIREAQAFLVEDPVSRSVQYRTKVKIRNAGTGRMPVPLRLSTEGDPILQQEWLEGGEEKELTFTTLDRPLAFEIDPFGWIAKEYAPGKPKKGREWDHLKVLFKTVTTL